MQAALERKQFNLKALDVDTTTRSVKIAIAELESIDRDNEVFSPTAFDKTIAERGPKGTNEVWHMTDHGWSLKSALSKFKELYKEGKYIVGVSQYRDTALWRDTVWPLYEAGDINQHSVGFRTVKSVESTNGEPRELLEVTLWEGSAVLWGANPHTPVLGLTKSAFKQEDVDDAISRYDKLIKAIKSGRFDDDDSLLTLELKRLQQFTIDLSRISTEPGEKSTQPVKAKDLVELIQMGSEIKNTVSGLFN